MNDGAIGLFVPVVGVVVVDDLRLGLNEVSVVSSTAHLEGVACPDGDSPCGAVVTLQWQRLTPHAVAEVAVLESTIEIEPGRGCRTLVPSGVQAKDRALDLAFGPIAGEKAPGVRVGLSTA